MLTLLAQTGSAGVDSQSLAFLSFVTTHWQFCLLHFLEFAIWGAWIVVLGNLLNARGFSRKEIGSIYACMPIGSMITPLIIGPLADKLFNTEVLIGVLHLIGRGAIVPHGQGEYGSEILLAHAHVHRSLSPTLSLVNAIIFSRRTMVSVAWRAKGFLGSESSAPWVGLQQVSRIPSSEGTAGERQSAVTGLRTVGECRRVCLHATSYSSQGSPSGNGSGGCR